MPVPSDVLPGGEAMDKLRFLSYAVGPTEHWCAEEDRAAALGYTLSVEACVKAGFEESILDRDWFRGINLDFRPASPAIASQAYLSVINQPEVAAAELDRLASLGGVRWFEKGCAPPDLRVCPSRLIARGGKVRVVRD